MVMLVLASRHPAFDPRPQWRNAPMSIHKTPLPETV
jgi:hypothetical protein